MMDIGRARGGRGTKEWRQRLSRRLRARRPFPNNL